MGGGEARGEREEGTGGVGSGHQVFYPVQLVTDDARPALPRALEIYEQCGVLRLWSEGNISCGAETKTCRRNFEISTVGH